MRGCDPNEFRCGPFLPNSFPTDGLPPDYFDLVPQSAVRYSRFPEDRGHNAVWDFGRGPGNTMYAALCGECSASVSVRLYEYRPDTGELLFCFDGGVETMASGRIIPPSKIHTSIHPTRDGKVVMTTHTTARSPAHPHWLFDSYYTHQWEGFPGSHVIEWDPARREAKVLGIPVARDSIYGAIYDNKHHALWFNTYLKGHLWRLDLASRDLRDFGQITEFGSYCLCKDRLGHLYTSSRSGHVFHINVDTCRITDLGVPACEPEDNPLWKTQRSISHHAQGPDGRLYLSFHFSDFFYALEPSTLKIERIGGVMPPADRGAPPPTPQGLAFDSKGVLWFATMRTMNMVVGSLCHLHRWDLLRGGNPERVGLIGTRERATSCVSKMLMDKNDVIHMADSNHGDDPPGILAVDTRQLSLPGPRVRTHDAAAYVLFTNAEQLCPAPNYAKAVERHLKFIAQINEYMQFVAEKANTSVRARSVTVVRLWEMLSREGAAVAALRWESENSLMVWCGPNAACRLRIQDGKVAERVNGVVDCPTPGPMPRELAPARLPSRQGRQYLAQPACWTPWHHDRWLIGSRDGVVACFDTRTGRTFALGAVGNHGPVHQIATNAARTSAFGVSGDPQDLGHVFHYDDETGLREVGRTFFIPADDLACGNTQPTTVALSPDGRTLAVGVIDALACVYLYDDVRIE